MKTEKRILSGVLAAFTAALSVLLPQPGEVTASAYSDSRIVVSLGDSYSSGEGIPDFYGYDDEKKLENEDYLAHRSTKSWPGQLKLKGLSGTLSDHKDTNWYFVAATGATTADLTGKQTVWYTDADNNVKKAELTPQLDVFRKLEPGSVDYVTLTLGGNDVDFAGIITAAVAGNEESLQKKLDSLWADFDSDIRSRIIASYEKIAEEAGDQAALIVAGYPRFIGSEGFKVTMGFELEVTAREAELINNAVDGFNAALEGIVTGCRENGMNIWFAPVEPFFGNKGAYTDGALVNGIITEKQPQDLNSRALISSYSMHPNEEGAKMYAAAVQTVIDGLESGKLTLTSESASEHDITAVPDGSSVHLSWNEVSGAESYTVYVLKNSRYKALRTTEKTSLTVTGLKNNKTYIFTVRCTSDGKLSESGSMTAVRAYFRPAPTASASDGQITLMWETVPGAEKYAVYRVSGGSLKALAETEKTSVRIKSATAGKKYRFAVKAYVGGKWTQVKSADIVTVTAA